MKFPETITEDCLWGRDIQKRQVEFITDNQTLADVLCGRTSPNLEHSRLLDSAVRSLMHVFGSCDTKASIGDPIVWRPRELNMGADHMCNIGFQQAEPFLAVNFDRLRETRCVQVHIDGGFLLQSNRGAFGFTVIAWALDKELQWQRSCLGVGAGQFPDCSSSFHAELYAFEYVIKCLSDSLLIREF